MSAVTSRPMQLFFVEFQELYARHLCRHSQLGINIVHLIALFGIWYAIYGLLYLIAGTEWVLFVPALLYLAALAPNIPMRVLAATTLFMAAILALAVFVPLPWWIYLPMLPAFYYLQAWSHKWFTIETDMTEFDRKYTKGTLLFIVLLLYEVPIVLHFLLTGGAKPAAEPSLHSNNQ